MFKYQRSYDKSISDDLKKRFGQEIELLERAGFRFFSLHQETIWPFSVIFLFPVYVLMANNEYVRVETPLRISSYHLMYVYGDGGTFAYVYGLGCKFYTKFVDGTWVVSNTAQAIRDEKVIVQKRADEPATTAQVWERHHLKLQEYQAKGMQPAPQVSFDDWVEIESRFDRSNAASVAGLGFVWMMFLSWVIFWFVRISIRVFDTIF